MSVPMPMPRFMDHLVRYERPGFKPADLLPEMAVIVSQSRWGQPPQVWRAKVISKARVLVKLEEIGRQAGAPKRWTMRLDTQREQGAQGNYVTRFRTIGQWAYDQTLNEARSFLTEQGIQVSSGSRWAGEEIRLARLVWPGRKGESA